jgi:hypothetical protein
MKMKPTDSKFSQVLKWVGYLTAILSLGAAIWGIVKFAYDRIERQRRIESLLSAEAVQLTSRDYWSAWGTLEQAAQIQPDSPKVRSAQESLAIAWLDHVHLSENQKFSDVTQKLEPVLTRAVADSKPGPRRADLRAYIGWAYFLETRDGRSDLNPAGPYAEAVAEDHDNPYAQAMWGHWILWRHCGKISEANGHFAAALASNREGDFVRRLQLSALLNCHDDEAALETIRVANAMRQEQRTINRSERDHIYSLYYGFDSGVPRVVRLASAVPPAEHVATFRWLFDKSVGDNYFTYAKAFYLAALQEAAGQRDDALTNYRFVVQQAPPSGSPIREFADAAIKRLSRSP